LHLSSALFPYTTLFRSCPGSRRDQVTRIMAGQPGQDWSGGELAGRLGVKPPNLLTQLAEWTRLGFLSKTGRGRYALPGPAGPARSEEHTSELQSLRHLV